MVMGMDGFSLGGGSEEFGDLGISLLFGLPGKGQIFSVRLGFTGKRLFKILFRIPSHGLPPFLF
jgi:hypothetical protein